MTWTESQIQFLKDNFNSMTSYQLSDALGISRTYVRMKYAELDLKKMELEFWTDEMVAFLKANYKTKGDVEIAEIFQEQFPKNKKWIKQHIRKKRVQLNLYRTKSHSLKIASANAKPGGNSYTIHKNSASVSLCDSWVAGQMAWRNKSMQKELLKHPQLIAIGRAQILLNRQLKAHAGNNQ